MRFSSKLNCALFSILMVSFLFKLCFIDVESKHIFIIKQKYTKQTNHIQAIYATSYYMSQTFFKNSKGVDNYLPVSVTPSLHLYNCLSSTPPDVVKVL